MKKLCILFLFISCLVCVPAIGQVNKGYIINIEGGNVYLDFTNVQVKVGERVEAVEVGGYMTHPKTGRKIKKEDVTLGSLTISETFDEYSVAKVTDTGLLSRLKTGMQVQTVADRKEMITNQTAGPVQENNSSTSVYENMQRVLAAQETASPTSFSQPQINDDRVSVVVAPAQVNDVVNSGHFGGYVADILMEQLLLCDKVRLLDRGVLNAQIDEINLQGGIIDPSTAIQQGKVLGARYILQTTMQKPDVANVRTGIPLASIMGAIQGASGTNIGAAYASNVSVATLRASVSLSVRVIDLQTGEVVFMCSGTGKSKGKSQLSLEYGALGGGELNGGAEDFKQTVTGKAIQQAFMRIGKNLDDFFNGRTDRKVVGSVSGGISYGDKMYSRGYKLYLNSTKLGKDDIENVFSERPELFFKYKKAKKNKMLSWVVGIGGSLLTTSIGSILASGYGDDEVYSGYAVIAAGIGGSVAGAILLNKSGQKKIKSVVDAYNAGSTYSYVRPDKTSECSLSFSPLGFRLTF